MLKGENFGKSVLTIEDLNVSLDFEGHSRWRSNLLMILVRICPSLQSAASNCNKEFSSPRLSPFCQLQICFTQGLYQFLALIYSKPNAGAHVSEICTNASVFLNGSLRAWSYLFNGIPRLPLIWLSSDIEI